MWPPGAIPRPHANELRDIVRGLLLEFCQGSCVTLRFDAVLDELRCHRDRIEESPHILRERRGQIGRPKPGLKAALHLPQPATIAQSLLG
jgi:hypothetical protein